ncbi:hypothetical protein JTB14_025297 [Gonioctena quinquepunctata]|nr:hypothetical protein JTB14_025297 [Gonioctena quinquepunctata]
MLASTDVATEVTWHRRLGHINSTDLLKMKHGVIEGLSCSGDIKVDRSATSGLDKKTPIEVWSDEYFIISQIGDNGCDVIQTLEE